MNRLTILICTYNRVALLERTLESLNNALRPRNWTVDLLVVANACTDNTHDLLETYKSNRNIDGHSIPLEWIAEPTPGKSHALNNAISRLTADVVAFVDDDHVVDRNFIVSICNAADRHPDTNLFCGRILPNWDGREPRWVHDEGPYRIYPLPVPKQDFGKNARHIDINGPIPGGGNQIFRVPALKQIGHFSVDLGPRGHDLGGGEDTEFILRALRSGERLIYEPSIVQYHHVDLSRFKINYLIRKAYHRSRASTQLTRSSGYGVPLYAWRKLIQYIAGVALSLSWVRKRFFLIRTAASLGEISGMRAAKDRSRLGHGLSQFTPLWPLILVLVGFACSIGGVGYSGHQRTALQCLIIPATTSAFVTLILLISSLTTFSRTGPTLRAEILAHYRRYTLLALLRLTYWVWIILSLMGGLGMALYFWSCIALETSANLWGFFVASLAGIIVIPAIQFCRHLLFLPGSICASLNFLPSRLYSLWRYLSKTRLNKAIISLLAAAMLILFISTARLLASSQFGVLLSTWGIVAIYFGLVTWALWDPEPKASTTACRARTPNILMIGSDTLRFDRLGAFSYRRRLTPHIDTLATRGTLFTQCYVPCARTAPSLLSLLTGTWPHNHRVRDNFIADDETRLSVPGLPEILRQQGYVTAAVSDWCGGDMRKFPLGFDFLDLPSDQWNIKYQIRQGPKNIRLMLSLFTHNRFGKTFLPELYYLAGIPMTREVGRRGRQVLAALSQTEKPFFLNIFLSTTHPPFGSEYPYYTSFADPNYQGESKFVMARLTDPFDIIRRQGQPKEDFDLNQILDLYDGCVKSFDDEVGRILEFLSNNQLDKNTIVVIYSDHGMEFFEHGTWGQGNSAIGDFSPRVPLLIRDPRKEGPVIVDSIVRSIDIAPTLLELVNLPSPSSMDGVSLARALGDASACPELDAFYETGIWIADLPGLPERHLRYPHLLELLDIPDRDTGTLAIKPQYSMITVEAKDRMIRSGRWKLVYQPFVDGYRLLLFDVSVDPNCMANLADANPEVTIALWKKLDVWLHETQN